MHKLTVTLKQHTPLIHFQHDQEGATLRASEVKPKLDKFIISRLTDEQKTEGRREGWLKEKDGKCWLDYKMRIESKHRDSSIHLTIVEERNKYYARINNQSKDEFPFLLCNMGGKSTEEELMNLSLCKENKLIFIVMNDNLCGLIEDYIASMFAMSNFGQRSTKGFGSFTVVSVENGTKEWTLPQINDLFPDRTPMLCFSVSGNMLDKQLMLFQTLDFYWKCLKSGVNFSKRVQDRNTQGVKVLNSERYIKPFLWTYLNQEKSKTWEKRLIKETFSQLQTRTPNRVVVPNNNQPIFARGMMGCPMFFEYKVPTGTFHKNNKDKWVEDKAEYRVNISNQEIERIPTPIVFKPILNNDKISIYVLFDDEAINAIRNESSVSFSFTCEKKEGNRYIPVDGSVSIDISPSSIDYLQLIQKYHLFLGTDREVSNSIFSDTNIKGEERRFRMIPRNFRWENILGQTGNSENVVSFFQVKHNLQ